MILCLIAAAAPLWAQGIEFFHGTYEQAKEKAERENKNIFVDVNTSWCGPCKQMSAKVFTDKSVGDYFNANFVCLKLDAEKESDHGFFRDYQANGYPSFFWVDARGQLLGLSVGYQDAENFIKTAKEAVGSRTGQRLAVLEERWNGGQRDATFVREYIDLLSNVNPDRVRPTVVEYIEALDEATLQSRETFEIISGFMRDVSNDPIGRALLKYAGTYAGYGDREQNMIRYYRMAVRATIVHRDNPQRYRELTELIRASGSEFAPLWLETLRVEEVLFAKDFPRGIPMAEALILKYGQEHPYLGSQLLYTLVIADYFRTEAPESLNDTVYSIADRAMRIKPCQENMLYLAATVAKSGDYRRAYQLLASIAFYPDPKLSNAVYKYLNLPVTRDIYPW